MDRIKMICDEIEQINFEKNNKIEIKFTGIEREKNFIYTKYLINKIEFYYAIRVFDTKIIIETNGYIQEFKNEILSHFEDYFSNVKSDILEKCKKKAQTRLLVLFDGIEIEKNPRFYKQ